MSTVATLAVALVAQHEAFTAGMNTGAEAVKGFERTQLSLKGVMESVTTPTERYEKQVEQLNKWMEIGKINADQYARAVQNAARSMEMAQHAGHGAEEGVGAFGERMAELATEILPAVSAAEAVIKTVEGVKQGFENVGEIGRGGIRLGISPEEFSRLKYAAEVSHVSAETMEADMGKMLNAIQKASQGGGELPAVFSRLHLSIESLRDAEPAEAFEKIGDAIAHVANRAERMNDVREIFGRAGTAILPMIENMRALELESDKVGFTRTADDVAKVEAAEKEWARTTKQLQAAFMDLGTSVAPMIEDIARKIAHAIEGARSLPTLLKGKLGVAEDLNEAGRDFTATKAMIAQATAAYDGLSDGFRPKIQAEEVLLEAMKKQHETLQRVVKDQLELGGPMDVKNAMNNKAKAVALGGEIEDLEKDIGRRKEALKEYVEYLDGMFEGESSEMEQHNKRAKQSMREVANAIAESFYGETLSQYEEEARDSQREFNREMQEFQHLLSQSESPLDKTVKQIETLNNLFSSGAIKDYNQYIRAYNQAVKDYQDGATRELEKLERDSQIKSLHGEGDFMHTQGDRKRDATEVSAGVDPRFMHSQDDERNDRKKQLSLTEELVKLMQEQVNLGPAVVTN